VATLLLASWTREPLLLLLAALVIDGVFPPCAALARHLPNPLALTRQAARMLRQRLDRPFRDAETRRLRGMLVTGALVGAAALLGWIVQRLAAAVPAAAALQLLLLVLILGQRRTFSEVRAAALALGRGSGGLVGARGCAGRLLAPGWDAKALDAHGVARVAITAAARGFAERVAAPVFWFALLGLPAALAVAAANAIAEREPRPGAFLQGALRLDNALQLLPSACAAFILALAAFAVPQGRPVAAIEAMATEKGRLAARSRGWPLAAVAGALGLALAGPQQTADGQIVPLPWIGNGRARAEGRDVEHTLYLFAAACLIDLALVTLLAWLRYGR